MNEKNQNKFKELPRMPKLKTGKTNIIPSEIWAPVLRKNNKFKWITSSVIIAFFMIYGVLKLIKFDDHSPRKEARLQEKNRVPKLPLDKTLNTQQVFQNNSYEISLKKDAETHPNFQLKKSQIEEEGSKNYNQNEKNLASQNNDQTPLAERYPAKVSPSYEIEDVYKEDIIDEIPETEELVDDE